MLRHDSIVKFVTEGYVEGMISSGSPKRIHLQKIMNDNELRRLQSVQRESTGTNQLQSCCQPVLELSTKEEEQGLTQYLNNIKI